MAAKPEIPVIIYISDCGHVEQ